MRTSWRCGDVDRVARWWGANVRRSPVQHIAVSLSRTVLCHRELLNTFSDVVGSRFGGRRCGKGGRWRLAESRCVVV